MPRVKLLFLALLPLLFVNCGGTIGDEVYDVDDQARTRGGNGGGSCASLFFAAQVSSNGRWAFTITSDSAGTWGDISTDLDITYLGAHHGQDIRLREEGTR